MPGKAVGRHEALDCNTYISLLAPTHLFFWSIVDLQCFVNFCYTTKWFSYTHILFLFSFLVYSGRLDIVPCALSRTLLFIHSKCNSSHLLTPNCLSGSASQLNMQTLLRGAPGSQQAQLKTPLPWPPPRQWGKSSSALLPIQLLALNSNTVGLPRAGSPHALSLHCYQRLEQGLAQPSSLSFTCSFTRSADIYQALLSARLRGARSRALLHSTPLSGEGAEGAEGILLGGDGARSCWDPAG